MTGHVVDLEQKLGGFPDHWRPRVVEVINTGDVPTSDFTALTGQAI